MSKIKKKKSEAKKGLKKQYPFTFSYQGRTIVIDKKKKSLSLTIDGEDIPVAKENDILTATSHAPYNPFYYPSCLEDLAMFITENVINKRCDLNLKEVFTSPTY